MVLKPSLLKFKFDDLESILFESGGQVTTELVKDENGNPWKLMLAFEADDHVQGENEDPYVALYLCNKATVGLYAKCTFILRDELGKAYCEKGISPTTFKIEVFWGMKRFLKRSKILDKENNILVGGAIHIDAYLQFKPEENCLHVPRNPFSTNMLKLLENDDDADVSFQVDEIIIPAHKLILKMNAPILFDFCEEYKVGTHIQIKDTTPSDFRTVLRYVYGGDTPNSVTEDTGKDLIIAANRYNVQGLKLAVETKLVEALILKNENVAEWFLFADAQTCPLLKEHTLRYLLDRAPDLVNSKWLAELNESPKLMKEMMVEMTTSLMNDSRFDNTQRDLSVNELRKRLHEKGLDVDGSKSMLISRLQE